MIKKIAISLTLLLSLGACSLWSSEKQAVFHWRRNNTGVQRFARDHAFCMEEASPMRIMPHINEFFRSIIYTEEKKLEVRADWKSNIWASYVPYPGAEPLVVNALHSDEDVDPGEYSSCMHRFGYTTRISDIPEITNIEMYKDY